MTPTKDTPKKTWAKNDESFSFATPEDCNRFMNWFPIELQLAKAEGAREEKERIISILEDKSRFTWIYQEGVELLKEILATLKGKEEGIK